MDESWRMSIGDGFVHNGSSRRWSTERDRRMNPGPAEEDDFRDVFGGPPRLLLLPPGPAAGFCNEVFSPPASAAAAAAGTCTGRKNLNMPGFCQLPPRNNDTSTSNRRLLGSVRTQDGFYDDIFGSSDFLYTPTAVLSDRDRRPRSRPTTKPNSGDNCNSGPKTYDHDSSSHLRANPLGSKTAQYHHDATLSSFASKLRPIIIPTRQHDSSRPSASSRGGGGESSNRTLPVSNRQYLPRPDVDFSPSLPAPSAEANSYYCANCCRRPSGRMTNDMYHSSDFGSPSSAIFEPMELRELEKEVVAEVKRERERSDFANHHFVRETEGAAALDEAIAWAREKFWNQQQASDRQDVGSDEILEYSEEAAKGSKENTTLFN